ncbi:class I SAM-dependent methyltransferase [Luteipulveratus mongoliensis]|uniref:Uncharacterized protein n=1 Tax=Luteipulveratus mongoliensis TaxID=571913 RepID=A0A0K1JPE3_9MICO|nr:class I SAM-dependent methyltransferase [Luteipulveratus mongoliensis]AKU18435.1 hypothetical protein VV02_25585 [Luteipulveratus mongoliensis]
MTEPHEQVERIRAGYNALSRAYRGDVADGPTQSQYAGWLGWVRDHTPEGGHVVDLGCGNGIPASKWLVDNGFRVTGVDVSDEMIERAHTLVPGATFVRADLTDPAEFDLEDASIDAAISLYALIHIPLECQRGVIGRIARWLRPGGLLVATVGHTAWQGREQGWLGGSVEMWWSHPDASTYRDWLEEAGLEVVHEEFVPEGSSGHQLMIARRA